MSPVEIGIMCGVAWAMILVVWTLTEMTTGEPSPWIMLVFYVYQGFNFTTKGIITGACWAFADGFVSGFVISFMIQWIIS